jgi:hypothetical protein
MRDSEAVGLLHSMLESAEKTTREEPAAFYITFRRLENDLNRSSRHIENNGLRKTYFHVGILASPLRACLNYDLQNRIYHEVRRGEIEMTDGMREPILDASTSVTVDVLSDIDGRKIIDSSELRSDLSDHLSNRGDQASSAIFIAISGAIRRVYDEFVAERSDELASLYRNMRQHDNWDDVMRVLSQKTIELDNQAISWRRSKGYE